MYGGLQAAIGALAALAVVRGGLVRTALLTLFFLTAGLASARIFGVALDGGLSSYTATALAFEIPSALIAWWLLRRAAAA
jgi:hypothetical protein